MASNRAGLKNLQRQYALYGTLVEILKDEKEFVGETSLCGRRREPSQHNIVLFPKKNLETCILSIAHAIPMQPLRVKAVAVTKNSTPVVEGEHGQKRLGQNGENG